MESKRLKRINNSLNEKNLKEWGFTKLGKVNLMKEKEDDLNTIQILGNRENKTHAFGILMNCTLTMHITAFTSVRKNVYVGVPKKAIGLLKDDSIDFKFLKKK